MRLCCLLIAAIARESAVATLTKNNNTQPEKKQRSPMPSSTCTLRLRRGLSRSTPFSNPRTHYSAHTMSFHSAATPSMGSKVAQHAHKFLSVGQALQAATSTSVPSQPAEGCGAAAAGLTFTLPPFCIWGASLHAHTEGSSTSTSRHAGSSAAGRYASLWSPIEAHLAQLNSASLRSVEDASSTWLSAPPAPPVFAALRLFPDLTVAQLPPSFIDAPPPDHAEGHSTEDARFGRSRWRRRRPAAPHEQPLEAILATEEPWGSEADPQQVFRRAVEGIHEMGQRLLPQVPLVLQLPTRLLVSQYFLEALATELVRGGWRSVSFELPSTQQLYSPFQSCPPTSSSGGGGGLGGSKGGRWAGRSSTLPAVYDDGAVDAAWCRLPLLCASWPTLCRHPTLGPSLRHLRRHDVVPFHVLFSWAVGEAQLFQHMEQGVVVDVTAPLAGAAMAQAVRQGPSSVGVSAEEARRVSQQSRPAPASSLRDGSDEMADGDEDSDTAFSAAQDLSKLSVYMRETPAASRSTGVSLGSGVVDAVRQHQSKKADEVDRSSQTTSSRADLASAESAWRRAKEESSQAAAAATTGLHSDRFTPASPHAEPSGSDAVLLVLDAPPDHLRALIEQSISTSDASPSAPAVTPRQRLLQKVGQFVQHSLQQPDEAEDLDPSSPSSPSASPAAAAAADEAALAREAAELEELLRQANDANDAADANGNVEHMMQEMQRYMSTHAQGRARAVSAEAAHAGASPENASSSPSAETSVWSRCSGHWATMHTLLASTTQSKVVWTLPTYNADAVRAWTEAYASSQRAERRPGSTAPTTASPLPVIPVWMPPQSVMKTEVERLLREGRDFPQPKSCVAFSSSPSASAGPTLKHSADTGRTWLPGCLNTALQDALVQLPKELQTLARRRLLHSVRVLRESGAQGVRRGGCEIRGGATTAEAPRRSHASPSSSSSSWDTDASTSDRETEDSDGDEDASDEVRIRLRRSILPLYLLPPLQVAQVDEAEARRVVEEVSAHATESTTRDDAKALLALLHNVDAAFELRVMEYYARGEVVAQRSGHPSSLYVPTPGLDATLLRQWWRLIA